MIKQALYVDIELDKPRRLRFDMNMLSELEEIYDDGVVGVLGRFEDPKDFGVRDLRKIIYAALVVDEPEITLRGVGAMMTGRDYAEMTKTVMEGLTASLQGPNPEKKSEDVPEKSSVSAGKNSGATRSDRSA